MDGLRELFLHPSRTFAPWPFWFWNDRLDDVRLCRQLDDFAAHGVGGVVIHPRMGLPASEPYLSPAFLGHVRAAVEHAASLGLRVMLYDEGMYPSGSAHGAVARENPAWASRGLFLRETPAEGAEERPVAEVEIHRSPDGAFVVRTPEDAPEEGWERRYLVDAPTRGTIRGVHPGEDDGEPDAPPSADLLNPDAVDAFIRHTHEVYYRALAPFFGTVIRAFFTDEPSVVGRCAPRNCLPWTEGFLAECGLSPVELAALLLGADPPRARFRRAVSRRLNRVYYGRLAAWCEGHGVALTGHPALSGDLSLERHFTWPGQDLVWRWIAPEKNLDQPDSVLGRCAASEAVLAGRERVLNECFGCCGPEGSQWALTMDNLKWYADWLMVRGTNLLVPHAFFYSIREERAEERPPDVGPHNTVWPFWGRFAAYCARLCGVSAVCREDVRVGVITPGDQPDLAVSALLLQRQTNFVYVDGERLAGAECLPDGRIRVGARCLEALILPPGARLEEEAEAALARFTRGGGLLLSAEAAAERFACLRTETPCPDLRALPLTDGEKRLILLTNEGEETIDTLVTLPVPGAAEAWDAWTGEIRPLGTQNGRLRLRLPRRESLLIRVDPGQPETPPEEAAPPRILPVSRPWTMHLPDGSARYLAPDREGRLPGWTAIEGLGAFSGTLACETVLTVDGPLPTHLDLGDIRETASLFLNGKPAGQRLWAPFVFPVEGLIRRGVNHLRLEITNTPANAVEGKAVPSGILRVAVPTPEEA